jgi:hypothetical protein
MDAGKNGNTGARRVPVRWVLMALLVTATAGAPLIWWSVRQSRLTNEALARAIAAESAAARAQNGVDQHNAARDDELKVKRDSEMVRAKHRPSKADIERTRQLSEEIEGLDAIQEKIETDLYQLRMKAARDAKIPKQYYPLP